MVIPYRRFGTTYLSHPQGSEVSLRMGAIGGPETSVRNYYYSLRNSPEERSSNLLRGGNLKYHEILQFLTVLGSIPGGVTGFFPCFLPTKPCALRSTQPLKMSTRGLSWGKGGRCIWLTTYHPCSAESREDPEP